MLENHQVKVLCIEGKRNNRFAFTNGLTRKGYQVITADRGSLGLNILDVFTPHMIIINAASLRTNGQRITSWFRNRLPQCPILVITAEDEPLADIPDANIVLQLPFTVQKLVNRMHTFQCIEGKHAYKYGPIDLNLSTNIVTCNEKETHLTPRLANLLKHLMDNPGVNLSREELFKAVWDTDYTGDTRTLDVHISWLRQAIEEDPRQPQFIVTIRSIGYRLDS